MDILRNNYGVPLTELVLFDILVPRASQASRAVTLTTAPRKALPPKFMIRVTVFKDYAIVDLINNKETQTKARQNVKAS